MSSVILVFKEVIMWKGWLYVLNVGNVWREVQRKHVGDSENAGLHFGRETGEVSVERCLIWAWKDGWIWVVGYGRKRTIMPHGMILWPMEDVSWWMFPPFSPHTVLTHTSSSFSGGPWDQETQAIKKIAGAKVSRWESTCEYSLKASDSYLEARELRIERIHYRWCLVSAKQTY